MKDPKASREHWENYALPKFCRQCGEELGEPRVIKGLYNSMTGEREKVKVLDCRGERMPYVPHDKWYIEGPYFIEINETLT